MRQNLSNKQTYRHSTKYSRPSLEGRLKKLGQHVFEGDRQLGVTKNTREVRGRAKGDSGSLEKEIALGSSEGTNKIMVDVERNVTDVALAFLGCT
jgi:hypothetical protein